MSKKTPPGDKTKQAADADQIIVYGAAKSVVTRGGGPVMLDVDTLARNVQEFLKKVERILQSAIFEAGGFSLTELEVSAEISASGKLGLLGSGIEVGGKGGLKFKFQKK